MGDRLKQDTYLYQLILSISSIMSASDTYTAYHQNNVSVIARMIGQTMNLSAFEIEGIRVAGQVHDIGKAAIPRELLAKFGALTREEFSLIKTHAERATDILSGIDFAWPVQDMVLQHHERLDGSGYPHGLAGDEICLGARILAVADVADAIINPRPYRKALGLEAVIGEIARNVHLYDKDVCNAFMKIVADGGRKLIEAIQTSR